MSTGMENMQNMKIACIWLPVTWKHENSMIFNNFRGRAWFLGWNNIFLKFNVSISMTQNSKWTKITTIFSLRSLFFIFNNVMYQNVGFRLFQGWQFRDEKMCQNGTFPKPLKIWFWLIAVDLFKKKKVMFIGTKGISSRSWCRRENFFLQFWWVN